MKDIAIIDSFPNYRFDPVVLDVGCGSARIDFHLMKMGFKVYATDYRRYDTWKNIQENDGFVKFYESDLFHLEDFPIKKASIVICSQVLEHLENYKNALKNLLELTEIRLIITIPYKKSFYSYGPYPKGHINLWSDKRKFGLYKDVKEFYKLCRPYNVNISKIRTKIEDVDKKQYNYLIIINKRQNLIFD